MQNCISLISTGQILMAMNWKKPLRILKRNRRFGGLNEEGGDNAAEKSNKCNYWYYIGFVFIWSGSLPFAILLLLVNCLAFYEYNAMLKTSYKNNWLLLISISIFIIIATYLNSRGLLSIKPAFVLTTAIYALFIYHIFMTDNKNFLDRLAYNLLGLVYITAGVVFLLLLRDYNLAPFRETKALWLVLLTTWAADTGAYFIGMRFGKTKFIKKPQ